MNFFTFAIISVAHCSSSVLPPEVQDVIFQQATMDLKNAMHFNHTGIKIPGVHIDENTFQQPQGFFHGLAEIQSQRESALIQAQYLVMHSQEAQESLNRRLRSQQYTSEFLQDYSDQSGRETNGVVHNVTNTMQSYSPLLRHVVVNFLLAPYLTSVTVGADLYNIGIDRQNWNSQNLDTRTRGSVKGMTTSYSALASLGLLGQLSAAALEETNSQIIHKLL